MRSALSLPCPFGAAVNCAVTSRRCPLAPASGETRRCLRHDVGQSTPEPVPMSSRGSQLQQFGGEILAQPDGLIDRTTTEARSHPIRPRPPPPQRSESSAKMRPSIDSTTSAMAPPERCTRPQSAHACSASTADRVDGSSNSWYSHQLRIVTATFDGQRPWRGGKHDHGSNASDTTGCVRSMRRSQPWRPRPRQVHRHNDFATENLGCLLGANFQKPDTQCSAVLPCVGMRRSPTRR